MAGALPLPLREVMRGPLIFRLLLLFSTIHATVSLRPENPYDAEAGLIEVNKHETGSAQTRAQGQETCVQGCKDHGTEGVVGIPAFATVLNAQLQQSEKFVALVKKARADMEGYKTKDGKFKDPYGRVLNQAAIAKMEAILWAEQQIQDARTAVTFQLQAQIQGNNEYDMGEPEPGQPGAATAKALQEIHTIALSDRVQGACFIIHQLINQDSFFSDEHPEFDEAWGYFLVGAVSEMYRDKGLSSDGIHHTTFYETWLPAEAANLDSLASGAASILKALETLTAKLVESGCALATDETPYGDYHSITHSNLNKAAKRANPKWNKAWAPEPER
mmetsp:Transcript_60876/g.145094  ORF Transcript_60876/g.145094 Transcript_60876/m.145094 type:complete len:332 (-) Transcript_60876:77-1072(-)